MIDVNKEVRKILNTLEGVTVTYFHPEENNALPVVSYYEITTKTGFCCDNAEAAQKSYIALDIWAHSGAESSKIAIDCDGVMQRSGWTREFSADLPPENDVYHKSMRFFKEIFF